MLNPCAFVSGDFVLLLDPPVGKACRMSPQQSKISNAHFVEIAMKQDSLSSFPSNIREAAWEAICKLCEATELEPSMTQFFTVLAEVLPLTCITLGRFEPGKCLLISRTTVNGTTRYFKEVESDSPAQKAAREWQRAHHPVGGILIDSPSHPYAVYILDQFELSYPMYIFKRSHMTPSHGGACFTFQKGTIVEDWMITFLDQVGIPLQPFVNVWVQHWELERLKTQIMQENTKLRNKSLGVGNVPIIGAGDGLKPMVHRISQLAPLDITVLIRGETGSGKDVAARMLHEMSERKSSPYVAVNCGAIPPSLIDSELFGHMKGAFTGAIQDRKGLFERADGGTLFLDEVAELPLEVQARLLRVLETRSMERIGGSKTLSVNFRLISATNKNLEEMVASGRFRQDLYYRLHVATLAVPPLREHKQDIPLLLQHFLEHAANRFGILVPRVSPQELNRLMSYDWPGNVRELQNVVEEALAYALQGELTFWPDSGRQMSLTPQDPAVFPTYAEYVRDYLARALKRAGGKIRGGGGAAEIMGLHYSTTRAKLRKYQVPHGRKGFSA